MTQAPKPQVDEVLHVPASLALHQRPGVPGIRSTFGTGTELLNSLRLMFSRLAEHRCPNGHSLRPTLAVAAEQDGKVCAFPATPCGACRQVMAQYQARSGKPMEVLLVGSEKIWKFSRVDDILPFIFDSLK